MIISLQQLNFHALHGLLPQEQCTGGHFTVDVRLHLPDAACLSALAHDDLSGTVNYAEAHAVIVREMQQPSALLEHVASRIASALLHAFPPVQRVQVSVAKHCPPIAGYAGGPCSVQVDVPRRLVVLDFDGTLADTRQGILATMQATFAACGASLPPEADVVATIGLPLHESLAMLGGWQGEALQHAVDTYRTLFEQVGTSRIEAFPGVLSTLRTLHTMGCTLAVATSRGHASVVELCARLSIAPYIRHVLAADDVQHSKPHPEAVLRLQTITGVLPERTWVIGDTTFDVDMGHAAQALTIAVTYGNHTPERLASSHPHHIVHGFEELLPLIVK